MSSNENKLITGKLQMFTNLLYHIDDYILNKKERKGQLNVSKNIRLVLREVISSLIVLNMLINGKDGDYDYDTGDNKTEEEIKIQNNYIKTINPLSFNQKNLDNISLFYNSNNEIFILNYLSLEKLFFLIRYCFLEIIHQKNNDYNNKLNNNQNLVLNNMKLNELFENFDDDTNEENILKRIIKKKFLIEKNKINNNKIKLAKIKLNKKQKYKDNYQSHTIGIGRMINNNYDIQHIEKMFKQEINNDENNKKNNNYLMNQIRKINKVNPSLIQFNHSESSRTLKNSVSLPLIYDRIILNHKIGSDYRREKANILNKINLLNKQKSISNGIENNYLLNNKADYFHIAPLNKIHLLKNFNNRNLIIKK